LFATAAGAIGCKKPPPPPEVDAGKAIDHLGPNEIPEGREKAFALTLPFASDVHMRLTNAIEVESTLEPEQLSNYVRARVQAKKVIAGANQTTFEDAIVPAEPTRMLRIEVRNGPASRHKRSSMMIRDVTPGPAAPKISDEDSWRKAGRDPQGKPLDPKHMF
jgi:hypothetical protein